MDKNLSLLLSNVKGIGNAKIRKFYESLGFNGMDSKALYDNGNMLYEAIQSSKIKPAIAASELALAKAITEKNLNDCRNCASSAHRNFTLLPRCALSH